MIRTLVVWMNGERVAVWQRPTGRSTHVLRYTEEWASSARVRPLSLSLPITPTLEIRSDAVGHYFANLLPDSETIRARLARRFGTGTEPFDLLAAIGRDCVGAVQLLPEDESPVGFDRVEGDPLTPKGVERLLQGAVSEAAPAELAERDFRISIAGAQEKTALLRWKGRWYLPRQATPTTHIIKLPMGAVGGARQLDLSTSVENEWICGELLRELGLAVARSEMATFGSQRALVVERFDRERIAEGPHGAWIARLPQEDFCQATGTPPQRKYEADGGPGMARVLELLRASDEPQDRATFLRAQLAFWLLAAIDGHAKNFSIFLLRGSRYHLTPLYDVISAWPIIGRGSRRIAPQEAKLAMAVPSTKAHWRLSEILPRHWKALASRHGGARTWEGLLDVVERMERALSAVSDRLPKDFPPSLFDAIAAGCRGQVALFRRHLPAES